MINDKIRVLVVDDSALIREILSDTIRNTSDLELVGTASDGKKALEALKRTKIDIVTLDIEMPNMNGLETLDEILKTQPLPVIMVSALTRLGADVTLEALERGALDYVAKPDGSHKCSTSMCDELLRKIRSMAGSDLKRIMEIRKRRSERRKERLKERKTKTAASPGKQVTALPKMDLEDKCIAIGISTGGPPALSSLFEAFNPPLPPLVIVQHMPPHFTKSFASRLDSISQISVKEAETGDLLKPNHAYIAAGGKHLSIQRCGSTGKLIVRDGDQVSGHKPSVDVMMKSAAQVFGDRCLGVVMTGMGRDGSDGCKAIREEGGYVLGQDEATSDVYGMNKVTFLEGNVDRQFSLDEAAVIITLQVKRLWAPAVAFAK